MRGATFLGLIASFLLFAGVAFGQDEPWREPVSDPDRKQLVILAKRFMADMQRTRDVKPLVKKYFAEDFATCMRKGIKPHPGDVALKDAQWQRYLVASINLYYIAIVLDIYRESGHRMPEGMPTLDNPTGLSGVEDLKTTASFMKAITKLEGDLARGRRFISRLNIERTKSFRQYVSANKINYAVDGDLDNAKYPSGAGSRRLIQSTGFFVCGRLSALSSTQ
jgi:hypothetical protein